MSQIGNISGKHIGQGNVHQQSETSEVRSSATSASNAIQNKDLYESSQVTDVHAAILAQPVSAPNAPMSQEAVNGANSFAHQISDLGPIGNNETVLTAQFLKLQMLAGEYDSDMANHVSQMQSGMLQSMHRQRIDLGRVNPIPSCQSGWNVAWIDLAFRTVDAQQLGPTRKEFRAVGFVDFCMG